MLRTLRVRMMLSYAGIALLVTLSLGAVLLFRLRAYYAGMERDYLNSNAKAISVLAVPVMVNNVPNDVQGAQVSNLAFLSQTRVRLLDLNKNPLADSGPIQSRKVGFGVLRQEKVLGTIDESGRPETSSIIIIQNGNVEVRKGLGVSQSAPVPSNENQTGGGEVTAQPGQLHAEPGPTGGGIVTGGSENTIVQPGPVGGVQSTGGQPEVQYFSANVPVTSGVYGVYLSKMPEEQGVRSDLKVLEPILDSAGSALGYVELSEGPAYGREIVNSVASGLAVAGGLAILLAVIAGWLTSRRLTVPLLSLKNATLQMSSGDLSVRVAEADRRDEFGSLGKSFNLMASQIEATVQTLRRFLADAAHELHTPLTALRTNLELALSADQPQTYLQRASEQVLRLEHLTNDLLDLSRIEGGSPGPEPAPIDLAPLVEQVCEPYAAQAEQAGVPFELSLPGGSIIVLGQERLLSLAVGNLIDNALKFTPSGGRVSVTLERDDGQAVLRVKDSGIGIVPEDLPNLFQRFHRGRNAAGYPGSGLGLSIVKAVTERHGGTVQAESDGEGVCFTLRLPRQEISPHPDQ
jgi:signal transduction histidine kinase